MRKIGAEIENLVRSYLESQGLSLVVANYGCKIGEIDLIMKDKEILVFIEVRYRKDDSYGDSETTVNKDKQSKIKRAALNYLQENELCDKVLCRFDVVGVSGKNRDKLAWIKDAFWYKW
jgi:putative endonuclease